MMKRGNAKRGDKDLPQVFWLSVLSVTRAGNGFCGFGGFSEVIEIGILALLIYRTNVIGHFACRGGGTLLPS